MVEESVEQLKKMRAIEHVEIAIGTLQKANENPIILNSLIQLHDSMVMEYNELYATKTETEPESAHPTLNPGGKKGKKESEEPL